MKGLAALKVFIQKVTWRDKVCTKKEHALLHIYKP